MLQFCIEAIRLNSEFDHQIIVHVNEGTDGTLLWIRNQQLDYTYSAANAGVCYAVNAMAKLAQTDLLLYLNDDMYVCKGWDAALRSVAAQMDGPLWYLSGTMIEPLASKNACAVAPHDFGRSPDHFMKPELDAFAARCKKPDWTGACWPPSLVSKTLFDAVGGYSVEFSPGMYSDPDFAMKLWKAGVRHFQGVGGSLVYHFMSRSTGRVRKNDGRRQFAAKWGIPSSYFYRTVLRLGRPWEPDRKLVMGKGLGYWLNRLKASWIAR